MNVFFYSLANAGKDSRGSMCLLFLFTAIVKDGVQFVMAANYGGFSFRRKHQTVQLSAFVTGGRQADQPGKRPMHTQQRFL